MEKFFQPTPLNLKATILFVPIVFILVGLFFLFFAFTNRYQITNVLANPFIFLLLVILFSYIAACFYQQIPMNIREDKGFLYPTLGKISLTILIDFLYYFLFNLVWNFFFGVQLTNLQLPSLGDSANTPAPSNSNFAAFMPVEPAQNPGVKLFFMLITISIFLPIIPYLISSVIVHSINKAKKNKSKRSFFKKYWFPLLLITIILVLPTLLLILVLLNSFWRYNTYPL